MKSYIAMAEKLRAEKKNEVDSHKKAADEARQSANSLRVKREAALRGADQKEYQTICRDIEYHENRAEVEDAQARTAEVPKEQYKQAWQNYRKEYDLELDKKLKAYNKLKEQLVNGYADILGFINEGNRERAAYSTDAGIGILSDNPEVVMPAVSMPLSSISSKTISVDGAVLVSLSDMPGRVQLNVEGIEGGSYYEGGVYGECYLELMAKKRNEPQPKSEERFLYEANGKKEYITRAEYRERQMADWTEAERRAFKREHGL